jgi:hypothetical protein
MMTLPARPKLTWLQRVVIRLGRAVGLQLEPPPDSLGRVNQAVGTAYHEAVKDFFDKNSG